MKLNNGDYIDAWEFTREECEKFCELAAEQGFADLADPTPNQDEFDKGKLFDRMVIYHYVCFFNGAALPFCAKSNITTQFRAYLDSKNPFTKADLKDGMKVEFRNGITSYVCGDLLISNPGFLCSQISYLNDDLSSKLIYTIDIIRVTDRDGAVVFHREPERKKVTIELTDEQIESLKQQGIID